MGKKDVGVGREIERVGGGGEGLVENLVWGPLLPNVS